MRNIMWRWSGTRCCHGSPLPLTNRILRLFWIAWFAHVRQLSVRERHCEFDIAAFTQGDTQEARALIAKAADALRLIAEVDPKRFSRMRRDLGGLLCAPLYGDATGLYVPALRLCVLDTAYLRGESISVYHVANTIVHEATHARLHRYGIRKRPANAARVESICVGAEIAFTQRIPDTEDYVDWLRRKQMELLQAELRHAGSS